MGQALVSLHGWSRGRLRVMWVVAVMLLGLAGFMVQPASAVVVAPDAGVNSVLTAGTGTMITSGQSGHISVVAYRTSAGVVTAKVLLCAPTCAQYKVVSPSIDADRPGRKTLRGVVDGIGPVEVTFDLNAANSRAYECVDLYASIAVQGLVVEPSYMAGVVGPWAVRTTGCGVWATTAALEYAVHG